MDTAPGGIVITDANVADNPIVYANEKFTELTGYEQGTVWFWTSSAGVLPSSA